MRYVRDADLTDVTAICGFVRELAAYEMLVDEVTFSESQYRDNLFRSVNASKPEVAIAETSEETVGFALFIQILHSTIHLEDLFVTPKARGMGFGLDLLSYIARIAIDRGANELEWACLDWNTPSLEFYKSIGALPITNRSLFRITGDSLRVNEHEKNLNTVQIVDRIPPELDPLLRGIELINHEGSVIASIFFTQTFTTFKGTPVFLICEVVYDDDPSILNDLIVYLIREAVRLGYSRIDIRVNESLQVEFGQFLSEKFGAFKMSGWIPFSLHGEALEQLARRKSFVFYGRALWPIQYALKHRYKTNYYH